MNNYDVIVIGAGHAGVEAAMAVSKMGLSALMLTLDVNSVGLMSCNPAIGGVGKGQLVKEIDALGGEMGRAADACAIQLRVLNASKGAAVQSSRGQIDMYEYNNYMRKLVAARKNLTLKQGQVKQLIIQDGRIRGVVTEEKEEIAAKCVVICPGTFLDGLIHIGLKHFSGGRINENASIGLADDLKSRGFNLMRFKTGTCPRLDKNSIDFSRMIIQEGDNPPKPFSFWTHKLKNKQVPCHIVYSNEAAHKIIRDNLHHSPLYAGLIKATGVRYCPSIEDKIVKFPQRARHQIFLEPQGLNTDEIYPNGISTSLPEDVQLKLIHSIEGLEKARVIRFGYGIEHTVVDSTQLFPTLESKIIKNLYFAGQINGTTGYEEAAAQGLVAGINAGQRAKNEEPFILERCDSYIGVLIDDLVTKGTNEPYRMFTSRVEYRLVLREDNADLRLSKFGNKFGLLNKSEFKRVEEKSEQIIKAKNYLHKTKIKPEAKVNAILEKKGIHPLSKAHTLQGLLKRPQVSIADLSELHSLPEDLSESAWRVAEIEIKYDGFIQRQLKDVERFKNLEKIKVPVELDYAVIPGLSREIKEKLTRFKPLNLGQASRISGVTPAAISLLMVYLRKVKFSCCDEV